MSGYGYESLKVGDANSPGTRSAGYTSYIRISGSATSIGGEADASPKYIFYDQFYPHL